jgi:hypothetical protein
VVTQLPPPDYGAWGGACCPTAGNGFTGTGTNKTYSTALNWTRTFSNTFLMEARGGVSYYHNVAVTTANGQNLADQVGIKGVNLGDEWTSGPPFPDNRYAFNYPVKQNNSFSGANSYSEAGSMAAGFR